MIGGRSLLQGFLYGVGHGANVLFGGFQLKIHAVTVVGIGQSGLDQLQRRLHGQHGSAPASALCKAPPAPVSSVATDEPTASAPRDASFAANAILGTVKSKSNGYGIVSRKDGLGDLQFLPGHVAPPGFEYVEVGDVVRFDVVKSPAGKWLAQRVVRS